MGDSHLNILLIHQAFVAPNEPGGTRHFEFGKQCVQKGHTFNVVASKISYFTGKPSTSKKGLVVEQNFDGVRVFRSYTLPVLHKSFVWRVISFISFMFTSIIASLKIKKVDVVMGTSPPIFQAVSAWFVSFLYHKPFLLEIRDLWPEFAIDIGVLKSSVLIYLSRWLERFLYNRATHILVNSPAYRDYLLEKGIKEEKISFISNGVDTSLFDPNAKGKKIREKYGLNDKFVITYAGALGLANDIYTLLNAADHLRTESEIHFFIAGDGKERSNLESFARTLNLSNITFAGAIPKYEMYNILGMSDACVAILKNITMFKMTYPNKVFDYMAAGRPTILAIDGVIRKVIEDAHGGIFVTPGDEELLASAIKKIYKNKDLAHEMGNSARNYVVNHFERSNQAIQFIELLEKLS